MSRLRELRLRLDVDLPSLTVGTARGRGGSEGISRLGEETFESLSLPLLLEFKDKEPKEEPEESVFEELEDERERSEPGVPTSPGGAVGEIDSCLNEQDKG